MSGRFVPIGEALNGLAILPIDDGVTALEAVLAVKALMSNGGTGWYVRYTEGLVPVESLGAAHALVLAISADVRNGWEPDEDDD